MSKIYVSGRITAVKNGRWLDIEQTRAAVRGVAADTSFDRATKTWQPTGGNVYISLYSRGRMASREIAAAEKGDELVFIGRLRRALEPDGVSVFIDVYECAIRRVTAEEKEESLARNNVGTLPPIPDDMSMFDGPLLPIGDKGDGDE